MCATLVVLTMGISLKCRIKQNFIRGAITDTLFVNFFNETLCRTHKRRLFRLVDCLKVDVTGECPRIKAYEVLLRAILRDHKSHVIFTLRQILTEGYFD